MNTLPNLPLIQERFLNHIRDDLIQNDIRYPVFEIYSLFPQVWGSTALGFGGFGGQAITSAYTTIICNEDLGYAGVFFNERLAYVIKHPNDLFWQDVQARNMVSVSNQSKYEKE